MSKTDDEIMEEVYEHLRLVPRMREPEDTRKRAAFLLAHEHIEKARECLAEPYRKKATAAEVPPYHDTCETPPGAM